MSKSLYDFCIERDEFGKLLTEWDKEKNVELTPRTASVGSHKRVWWKCAKGHEWQAEIKSRTNGNGCPVCANKIVVIGENNLGTVFPEIAAQWHPVKNGSLTPQSVVYGSHLKVWWRCAKGHEWQAIILSRTCDGAGCPVCTGRTVLPGENDLASQMPHLAAQWHPTKNNPLTPQKVTVFSNYYVWWICEKGHEYQSRISDRSRRGSGCPYCKNRKVLEGFNDLATREPMIAAQWYQDLNGSLAPNAVTSGSSKKVWWQCSDGHVWQAVISSRTGKERCGCPVCAGRINKRNQHRYSEIAAKAIQEKQKHNEP